MNEPNSITYSNDIFSSKKLQLSAYQKTEYKSRRFVNPFILQLLKQDLTFVMYYDSAFLFLISFYRDNNNRKSLKNFSNITSFQLSLFIFHYFLIHLFMILFSVFFFVTVYRKVTVSAFTCF